MKTRRTITGLVVASALALVPSTPALTAPPLDAGAGNWRMVVLTGPTQFAVAPPTQVTSAEYQAELTSIKGAQSRLTPAQRKIVEYWSAGGVVRWTEIMMGLVSRYNLPPAPAADGTYPVPDANNPFSDPMFPFGNPPYAARAYSYVAVAQSDALKAAWHYKFLYNRPSPARVDSGVQALVPATDLPAYPSEDAVLSGVTADLLRLLFPASVEEITLKAAEQRQAAIWAGKATASDVAAGVALGRAVATAFTARASTDGMATAGGSPALFAAQAASAVARGDTPWRSMESPPRPPMLANFGTVRAWVMTPADIFNERPGPPPLASSALMERDLAEVRSHVDKRDRRELAIANFWNDGPSTPTPPGHWNMLALPYVKQAELSEVRAARALALLNMAMHDAAVACWDAKFAYSNARPSQLDPGLKTLIGLPNFPSYTSGHSTFSGAAAEVLSYIFPGGAAQFEAWKEEASISRLYAGIHYRSDIEVGKAHGRRIGGYTVSFARIDGADIR